MKLSKKQSRAIAVLTKKQQKYAAVIKAYDTFVDNIPNNSGNLSLLQITTKFHNLQMAKDEAKAKVDQIDIWIMLISESEANVDEILLEILST